MTIKKTKLAFEERYSDDSGVEFAVRFDATSEIAGRFGAIEIEHVDKTHWPLEKVDWLIERLNTIKEEAES